MSWADFRHWLASDPAPGWIAWGTTVIIWYLRRKRPQHLLVTEVYSYPLAPAGQPLLTAALEGSASRVKTTFDDQVVGNPIQVILEITNEGEATIRNIELSLDFLPAAAILDASIVDADAEVQLSRVAGSSRLAAAIPHLNVRRDHQQTLRLLVLVDGPYEGIRVTGSGDGWSARSRSRREIPRASAYAWRRMAFANALLCGAFGVMAAVGAVGKIDQKPFIAKAAVVFLIVLAFGTMLRAVVLDVLPLWRSTLRAWRSRHQ